MENYQAWERAFAGFGTADFATEQEVREAIQDLRQNLGSTDPEWNISEEQEEACVSWWNSQQ